MTLTTFNHIIYAILSYIVIMTERLEIDVLRTLKAIDDCGGITRAADRLALSQSAVSHKIRRFERNTGCRLLRRRPGGAIFTDEGRRLVEYANRILAIHDEAWRGIHRPALEGRVQLGITEELVSSGLSRVLGRFARLYPAIRVQTRVEQSLVLDRWLEAGRIDMAVMQVFAPERRSTDLVLQSDRLVWVGSVDLDLVDSVELPFIAFDDNCFYRRWARSRFERDGRKLRIVLECASNEGVLSAVSAGMGVALIARRHLRADMIELDLPAPPAIDFVIRLDDTDAGPHLLALRDEIAAALGD